MNNRRVKSICLILGAALLTGGCKSAPEEEEAVVLAEGPAPDVLSAPAEYASGAIDAVGGTKAWTTTKQVRLDCVVTFFRPDGSFYLTEQSYCVYPWSASLEIFAREPQGAFAWRFSQGQFEVRDGADRADALPLTMASRCYSEAILSIVTAPVRFLDRSSEFALENSAVKMHGQWYVPIARKARRAPMISGPVTEAVFYQDRDNLVVDMIRFSCAAGNKVLTVRGYDYEEIEKNGPVVPTRIEILTGAGPDVQKRVARIDCHRCEKVQ